MLLFADLEDLLKGEVKQCFQNLPLVHLLYDSRKIVVSPTSVFFAIRTSRRDGHEFIPELYANGIRQFVVATDYNFKSEEFPEANFLAVADVVFALQLLCAHHRSRFSIPVVAITGSNGKTIVKEWLAQLLADNFTVVKNPRSYNSQIGVPISVWQMNAAHEIGIFEAGISKPGEMELLENVIKPTLGIFTNIGTAHDDGFEDRTEKITEKLKLYAHCEVLILNSDQKEVDQIVSHVYPHLKIVRWGSNLLDDIFLKEIKKDKSGSTLILVYKYEEYSLFIPFSDDASIQNLMHVIAAMIYFKIPFAEIAAGVSKLHPIGMRMEIKGGINGSYLIDDAYSNDLAGFIIALQFLDQQKQRQKKSIILSDFPEPGIEKGKLYHELAALLNERDLHKLIVIGSDFKEYRSLFKTPHKIFASTEDFLDSAEVSNFDHELILIKGARKFRFERIVRLLSEKVHGTVFEINLDALSHNLNYYRSFLKQETKIMVMVKAFAYGSGSSEVANLLQFHKVDYLAVAYADEGVDLRKQGITMPVMVMNPSWQSFEKMFQYGLEPELYNFKIFGEYVNFLPPVDKKFKVHIKFDTGMHRLGFENKDIEQLALRILEQKNIHVESVFTHLSGADEDQFNDFSIAQFQEFQAMATKLEELLGYPFLKHVLNSAGIVRFPQFQLDMVRLGIGLYGVETNAICQDHLQNIGVLKTTISQIRTVNSGDTIGYSRKGKVGESMKVATIAIGYADGYNRKFSNGVGKVLVNGVLCPIIGNVCMDMSMVDISGVKAEEGDVVQIFGDRPSIIDLANAIDTIPYEILTGVSQRVKRIYFSE